MKLHPRYIALITAGLLAAGCSSHMKSEKDEKDEGPEVKVTMDQVPAAVKDTLQKESGGASITSVDKESDEGKTIYEADAMIGGKNYEIKVAEDGSLISKKLDNEAEEKSGGEKEKD